MKNGPLLKSKNEPIFVSFVFFVVQIWKPLEAYGRPRGRVCHPHFLLANRPHFDFTTLLYVYRHLYRDNHAV
jgi:hypothetical protein